MRELGRQRLGTLFCSTDRQFIFLFTGFLRGIPIGVKCCSASFCLPSPFQCVGLRCVRAAKMRCTIQPERGSILVTLINELFLRKTRYSLTACLRSWFRKRRKRDYQLPGYSLENKVSSRTLYRLWRNPKSTASPSERKNSVASARRLGSFLENGLLSTNSWRRDGLTE